MNNLMLEFQTNRKKSWLFKSMGVSKIKFSEQKDFKTDFRGFFFSFSLCQKAVFERSVQSKSLWKDQLSKWRSLSKLFYKLRILKRTVT